MLRAAPRAVNIFDAQLENTIKSLSKIMRAQCGKGMSNMQLAIGTRRESCHNPSLGLGQARQILLYEVQRRQKIIPNYTTFGIFTPLTSQYVQIGWQLSECCNADTFKACMTKGE